MPLIAFAAILAAAVPTPVPPGEDPVAPYTADDGNAGAAPFAGAAMWQAFHGAGGVERIVDGLIARAQADRRIADIFKGQDLARLRRTLREQFCYILNGSCHYSGRDMASAHHDLGLQQADMGALVEDLQQAMSAERIAFAAQNRFLAKLAPMKRQVVVR